MSASPGPHMCPLEPGNDCLLGDSKARGRGCPPAQGWAVLLPTEGARVFCWSRWGDLTCGYLNKDFTQKSPCRGDEPNKDNVGNGPLASPGLRTESAGLTWRCRLPLGDHIHLEIITVGSWLGTSLWNPQMYHQAQRTPAPTQAVPATSDCAIALTLVASGPLPTVSPISKLLVIYWTKRFRVVLIVPSSKGCRPSSRGSSKDSLTY